VTRILEVSRVEIADRPRTRSEFRCTIGQPRDHAWYRHETDHTVQQREEQDPAVLPHGVMLAGGHGPIKTDTRL